VDAVAAWPWRGGLEPCGDHELASVEVEGTIPKDLKGSFYRVGPGRIRVGKQRYAHWFDGDGMIFGVELDGSTNTARAACKMVRTARLAKQERAGVENGVAVRGAWTQAKSPLANIFNFPTNPANTSPMFHAGKLLVLCEGGAPIEVDPLSLDTKGECVFGSNLPMGFSAHAKKRSKRRQTVHLGLVQTPSHRIPGGPAIRERHGGEGDQLTAGYPRVYTHPRLRDEREVPRVHRPAVEGEFILILV